MNKEGVTRDGVWYPPSLFDDDVKVSSDVDNEAVSVSESAQNDRLQVEIKDEDNKVEESKNGYTLAFKLFVIILAIVGVILLVTFGLAALLVLPILGISLFSKNKFMRL